MIDHEAHKIRIKAISDKIGHPMTYNDAGAPKIDKDYESNRIRGPEWSLSPAEKAWNEGAKKGKNKIRKIFGKY
jgi:hypothetical protein